MSYKQLDVHDFRSTLHASVTFACWSFNLVQVKWLLAPYQGNLLADAILIPVVGLAWFLGFGAIVCWLENKN